jgi:hypothetical protein
MSDASRQHGEEIAAEFGRALGLDFSYRFDLGQHGLVDWWARLDDRRLVFLEFEFAQRHPSTNVAKCWPWLKENAEARVLLIHVYDKRREETRPKGSRRRLAAFLGSELASVLDGRFRYVAIDAPSDREAIEQVRAAVARFARPLMRSIGPSPSLLTAFCVPVSSPITRSGNTSREQSQRPSVEKRLSAMAC